MNDVALVTGGAGFLGSHVADALLARGEEVVVLDDLSGGFEENVPSGATFVRGSILDRDAIERVFREHRVRHVYHLAAYAAEGLSHFIRRFNYENNLIGSVNLINASVNHGVECFVFTSSIAVYGAGQVPLREDMTPHPEDPYGIAKLAVEQDLKACRAQFGLEYVIFRPHNVYGERQNIGDRYRNVIGIFMNQIMQGRPLTVFGDGTQTRAFTYVGDIAPVIAQAPRTPRAFGEAFNVGADSPYEVRHLAEAVGRVMGAESRIDYLPARNEVAHAYSSHDKVRAYFECPPETPLEEGLARMAAWARQHGARQSAPFEGVEVFRGLPPSWQRDLQLGGEKAAGAEHAVASRPLLQTSSGDQAEILKAYIEGLPDWQMAVTGEPYDHMGAVISDAGLQAGINYRNVVFPRVEHLRTTFPEAKTTSGFLGLLRTQDVGTILSWTGRKKLDTIMELATLFAAAGVETTDDLRTWLARPESRTDLLAVKGVGSKTVDYLKLLVGLPAVAVDVHLRNFVKQAGINVLGYEDVRALVARAADLMGIDHGTLDHSIWAYVSGNVAGYSDTPEVSLDGEDRDYGDVDRRCPPSREPDA